MTVLEILKAARARIRSGWTQFAMARDALGNVITRPEDPRACAWCTVGAICAGYVAHEPPQDGAARGVAMGRMMDVATTRDPGLAVCLHNPLVVWNDRPGRTQAEVLGLFNAAIAAEERG